MQTLTETIHDLIVEATMKSFISQLKTHMPNAKGIGSATVKKGESHVVHLPAVKDKEKITKLADGKEKKEKIPGVDKATIAAYVKHVISKGYVENPVLKAYVNKDNPKERIRVYDHSDTQFDGVTVHREIKR